ncbi:MULTISPECIES: IS110 family transposase [Streptococcus]|uniref:IS110 family transposase n=1 Tax=Streptococcus TaxID=1301 RepID=UPI0005CDA35A|nr:MULTISPECIES: IS110 family transposase [Streptococcus]MDV5124087.1 IS110 family transposase [Streptococcus pasteurianus]MDV5135766.1 IS110 family transposase [Streptococcus pasteurianus]MDV5152039.1 IS110 family transposase [Streptococcus pasteurianus]MDV5158256.1 IS110 family transposase [Streptococcus pasteurianus]MDV5160268.1 IS110 family transposase [Streptococcus pasteurianus]
MRTVFGIDVSKASSEVAILVNGEKVHGYTMPNDCIGFSRLLSDLDFVYRPEVIFEATGVYSRRLQTFLENNDYTYTRLNPLEAKKQLDSLRVRKTDKIDAEKLALSQFSLNRKPSYVQKSVYQELRDLSRFYQNLTEDIVRTKNRLHKALQVTFPELETLLSAPTGKQYWSLVTAFPSKDFILDWSEADLTKVIRQSTAKRMSDKRVSYLVTKLLELAKQSYCAVKKASPMIEEVRYYAQELLRLTERRQVTLDNMIELAQPLPEYDILLSIPGIAETTATSIIGELGDVRRFQSANQINAFIGIDLRHYESGIYLAQEHITKRGNPYARKILFKTIHNITTAGHYHPCHIAEFYEKRKRQSQVISTKSATIAAMHRLIRTIHYLIVHNKLYNYDLAKSH